MQAAEGHSPRRSSPLSWVQWCIPAGRSGVCRRAPHTGGGASAPGQITAGPAHTPAMPPSAPFPRSRTHTVNATLAPRVPRARARPDNDCGSRTGRRAAPPQPAPPPETPGGVGGNYGPSRLAAPPPPPPRRPSPRPGQLFPTPYQITLPTPIQSTNTKSQRYCHRSLEPPTNSVILSTTLSRKIPILLVEKE